MWDYFDGIYILTTPNSQRLNGLIKNLNKVGINKYKIFTIEPVGTGVNSGSNPSINDILNHSCCDKVCKDIAKNHYTMIKDAWDRGLQSLLIFEDDARFDLPLNRMKLKSVVKWLKNNEWDLFYFGHCPWPKLNAEKVNKHVVKVSTPLTTHSFCLSRNGMKKILSNKKFNQHIDKTLAESNTKKYAVYPSICFQSIDPGLYRRIGLPISFRTLSKSLETLAVINKCIVVGIFLIIIWYFFIG